MSYSLVDFKELQGLSENERQAALEILNQFSKEGKSDKFNKLIYDDYEEIPVDIETFLKDPQYLGKGLINEEGKFTVYPYWLEVLKKVFPDNNSTNYNTLVLSGAIGLGKSFVAVLCMLYQLYRMMCLKDPYIHYGLQPIDKITFAFMNITLDASKGVAWDKCQQLLQTSPWFMSRGNLSGTTNITWNPPKGIELIAGSLSRHIIGRAVFSCLDEDTEILTNKGIYKIKDLVGKSFKVYNIKDNEIVESNTCTAKATKCSKEEYELTLEDGTVIKCTPEHRFLLSDGVTYKEAKDLTEQDDLFDYNNVGYIYKVTNKINNTFYIGQHKKRAFDKNYFGSGIIISRAIKKYGKNWFSVEVLDWCKSLDELNRLEELYISKNINNPLCLNISQTAVKGNTYNIGIKNKKAITNGLETKYIDLDTKPLDGWYYGTKNKGKIIITNGTINKLVEPDYILPAGWWHGNKNKGKDSSNYKAAWTDQRRKAFSEKVTGQGNPGFNKGYLHSGIRNGRYGKEVTQETRSKISQARKGKGTGKCPSKGRPGQKKPKQHGLHLKQAICKNIYYIDNAILYGDNDLIKYIKEIYSYNISSLGIKSIINKSSKAESLYPKLVNKIIRRKNNEDN